MRSITYFNHYYDFQEMINLPILGSWNNINVGFVDQLIHVFSLSFRLTALLQTQFLRELLEISNL